MYIVQSTPLLFRQQMLREHVLIRRDALRLVEDKARGESIFKALSEQLEAHVRLEERMVFPLIEAVVPNDALAEPERSLTEFLGEWI